MKKRRLFIQMLLIIGILFTTVTACDKNDDPDDRTVKDADGNKYNTVTIGAQVWMVENLKTTKYNDKTQIPNVTDNGTWVGLSTGAYSNFDNLESNAATYGRLYNWYAVNTGKLAPAGWHVPTDDDWTILRDYLIANGYNFDGTRDINKVAKSLCAKTDWSFSSNAGTPGATLENNNSTGFKALPCGSRSYSGAFNGIGKFGVWWSSSDWGEYGANNRSLSFNYGGLNNEGNGAKWNGFSVRLVKD